MTSKPATRLFDSHPRRLDVPGVALASLGLLVAGVLVPALTFDDLFKDDTFSVLEGISGFFRSGDLLLGVLLVAFSVLFPAAKVLTILVVWFVKMDAARRARLVGWLEILGKWSLLDAFVIAILVGTAQFGILTQARAEPGIYLYLVAILASLVATFLLRPLTRDDGGPQRPLARAGLWLVVPSAALHVAGLLFPLLHVEAGLFWESEFTLLDGTRRMFDEGEHGLAVALVVFVIVLPMVRHTGLIALRLLRAEDPRWLGVVRLIDRWSMSDVFVLALLVVSSKLGALAEVDAQVGIWLLSGSALLGFVDSMLLQAWRSGSAAR